MEKKKILLIDDDAAIRKWINEVLTEEGYDCQEAEGGESGASIAEVFMPDVILCDVEMPKVSGHDVYRRLSKNSKTSLIPFIFVTGRNLREDVRAGMTLGADDYLTKPMTGAELLDSVRSRLSKKKIQDRQTHKKIQQAHTAATHGISYDTLTHLPNRQLLLKQLGGVSQKDLQTISLAILSIGIDNLMHVTEAFGARGAETVLLLTTRRLKRCLNDGAVLYRGDYDCFNVLIWNVTEQEKIESQMQEIIRSLSEAVSFKKHAFRIKVSIGWTFYDPKSHEPLEAFLNRAKTARHYAFKEAEKSYHQYVPEMQKFVADRLMLENFLHEALKNKEFRLYYQPQVDIQTQKIKAVEALIRWKNRELGMISPMQFIPLAEESGLILPIGKWVLEESCRQLKEWQQEGLDLKMAVNISGRQLEAGDLLDNVKETLIKTGVPPGTLELEITESLLIKDLDSTLTQMKVLKEQGVLLAIDDFGTGYSSLSSLKKLPFDTLKIDRSFISDIETHSSNSEIVATIIKMTQTLKLKTIAEGVETREQLECLKNLHCDEYQGFLFSRPVPADEMTILLKNTLKTSL